MGFRVLFLILFMVFTQSLSASSCDDALGASKALERVRQLNPELVNETPESLSKLDLIMILKKEIWRLLPFGNIPWKDKTPLEESLKTRLHEQFNKRYRLDEMDDEDLYLFYANQVRSVYFLLVREWMEEELAVVESLTPYLKNFGLSLMSRSLTPSHLLSSTFSPEMTEEILNEKKWKEFPLDKAFQLAKEAKELDLSLSETMDWLRKHPLWEEMGSPSYRMAIETAFRHPGFNNPCCLTDPGCLLCPNNRSWLRKN